jgi:hypothetical protein
LKRAPSPSPADAGSAAPLSELTPEALAFIVSKPHVETGELAKQARQAGHRFVSGKHVQAVRERAQQG